MYVAIKKEIFVEWLCTLANFKSGQKYRVVPFFSYQDAADGFNLDMAAQGTSFTISKGTVYNTMKRLDISPYRQDIYECNICFCGWEVEMKKMRYPSSVELSAREIKHLEKYKNHRKELDVHRQQYLRKILSYN